MAQEDILKGIDVIRNDDNSITVGALNIATANECIERVKHLPPLQPLYDCFWYEEELSCLFASTNLGKSVFAVQIANEIAKTREVLYVDCELTDRQFRTRYNEGDTDFVFEENFRRAKIDIIKAGDLADDALVRNIRDAAVAINAKVIIIDNISWLSMSSEKSADAIKLMRRLVCLRDEYKFSILVIAHTPKLQRNEGITDNDMSGSKMLMNFFDSAFTIGKDVNDSSRRYIMQIKVRSDEYTYDKNKVLVCRLVKDHKTGNLFFQREGTAKESTLRRSLEDERDMEITKAEVKSYYQSGLTLQQAHRKAGIRNGTFKEKDLADVPSVNPVVGAKEIPEYPSI